MIDHVYMMKPSQNPKSMGVGEFLGCWSYWEGDMPGEGKEALCPFFRIWMFICNLYPFVANQ